MIKPWIVQHLGKAFFERRQLWLKAGFPAVIICAAIDGNYTYNVQIPLKAQEAK